LCATRVRIACRPLPHPLLRLPALVADRAVTPEPLNVAQSLVGQPLASPLRRAWAMGIDLVVVAVLSGLSNLWLGAGLLLVLLQLRSSGAGAGRWRKPAGWALVALFAALAAADVWHDSTGHRTKPAVTADDDDEDVAPAAVQRIGAGLPDAERIKLLEAALASARKPRHVTLRDELNRIADALGASFGWGIVYFSLLPALWNGQTLGKKFLRLRAVELTGKPMTVMRSLKRYGGYAAGMATGGLGFTQLLWDANRQAIQDRTAHTVVIDLRRTAQPP